MAARNGGDATGRIAREVAVERQKRIVHLVDGEVIRRALMGSRVAMTELEREAVIVIADTDGVDRELTAAGLGMKRNSLDRLLAYRRQGRSALTRDLQAAAMLRPAGELVEAVAAEDREAVAAVLTGLSLQQFAALAVVLAARVVDAESGGREQVAA